MYKKKIYSFADFLGIISHLDMYVQGPPNTYFLENALKKATEQVLKFNFLIESTIPPVNNGK